MEPAGRLRVALIAGTLGQGGAEKQLVYMARALREAGAGVEVFSLTSGEHHERELVELGVRVTPILGPRAAKLARLTRGLARFRPHVTQSAHTYANLYAALAGAAAGSLTLGALRSSLAHTRRGNGAWTRWHLSMPHGLVANSEAAAAELARIRGRRPVYVVPNAIDGGRRERLAAEHRVAADSLRSPLNASLVEADSLRSPLDSLQEGVNVAFVGRLIPEKRLDLFLDAIALARREEPRVRGVVVGDGPTRSAGEERALALGLVPDGVAFLGRRDDVPALLDAADMLLLCSDEEGFPNVLLEAMAAGLPVVATPAGDAAAIVRNGETGFVVSGGAEGLAERAVLLARSPELRDRMGKRGRQRAIDEYGFGKLCTRLLGVYRDLAGRRGHRRTLDALS
ncbi:MAG TPA: glycosyltransferase [Thermoanaerobaculia bacterium]|nr:glycosyltransferase [Thermoanaerobaculia bacterium]